MLLSLARIFSVFQGAARNERALKACFGPSLRISWQVLQAFARGENPVPPGLSPEELAAGFCLVMIHQDSPAAIRWAVEYEVRPIGGFMADDFFHRLDDVAHRLVGYGKWGLARQVLMGAKALAVHANRSSWAERYRQKLALEFVARQNV